MFQLVVFYGCMALGSSIGWVWATMGTPYPVRAFNRMNEEAKKSKEDTCYIKIAAKLNGEHFVP